MKPNLQDEDEVREAFWQDHPQFTECQGWKQNRYPADIRCAFVDCVDMLQKSGDITEEVAQEVTL